MNRLTLIMLLYLLQSVQHLKFKVKIQWSYTVVNKAQLHVLPLQSFIFSILPLTSPYAVSNLTLAKKHLVNDKITTSCPICLISTISKLMLQNVQITNMNFEKLLEHKMFFLSIPSFVSAVLFIPSFNVLSCYFYDSLNLVAVPTAWILTNFGTQLLYNVTLLTFATNNSPQLNSLVALTVYIPYFKLYRGNRFKENASQLLCLKSHIKSITLWITKKLI